MRTAPHLIAFVVTCTSLFACGPSVEDVLAEHAAPIAAKQKQVDALVAKLPPLGSVTDDACDGRFDPPPQLDLINSSNAELLALDAEPGPYWKRVSTPLVDFLTKRAAGGKEAARSQAPSDNIERLVASINKALAVRYLVMYRTAQHVPPNMKEKRRGGGVIEVFVADLQRDALRCRFRVAGLSDEKIETTIRHKKGHVVSQAEEDGALQSAAEGTLATNIGKALETTFVTHTGGTAKWL